MIRAAHAQIIKLRVLFYTANLEVILASRFRFCDWKTTWSVNILEAQQMYFGFMDVILLRSYHQHVSAAHVAILSVMRTRVQI